ncbi:NRDE family protein [Roseomonas rosulenta]|uniref:NRDE family protein n=1 Tax=Roseomonas rosulenta TaxID=2748667 RepID=UPI0018DFAF39|nr:NRDE family protein [Roseomonas rosulenta]
MCTVILLRRPGDAWPLIIAANRDERLDRAWDPPRAWWPDRPGIVGGRDRSAGGTWMALGTGGVVAAVLNRPGSLGPAPGKRSRGELPLLAASEADAAAAMRRLRALPGAEWRPFNMVVADSRQAFFLRGLGAGPLEVMDLAEGIAMVTAHDPNDPDSPRIRRHLPRFRAATPPDPAAENWRDWEALLADETPDAVDGAAAMLNIAPVAGFGTVCSSLLALGAAGEATWRFCPGRPASGRFVPLKLPASVA